ncbi:cation-translocating P-type ATPase [Adhaeribacter sp. BT258]|uniref:Cation-translocating P-type ATPase n=1 Tax=Adhaeribacter terrigena TaxID=2793070 RepID=A0ABS1BXZ7_9BACT|nr:cation-translocating P-type ATPase [Adhaeribacter terrigena]MBK0401782.1 cation-translocating P-type ATPase [Adhaeribacter terrigena]
MINQNWHTLSGEETLEALQTSPAGLSTEEIAARKEKYGPNELQEKGGKNPLKMLWEQFTQTMVLILLAAAVISFFLGETIETIAILAIVVLFAVLGFVQEFRAEKAMAALKKMSVPTVRVRRGNKVQEIAAPELVPGDILLLEAGNIIPADMRLLESASLRVQEAALTGEAEAVEKFSQALEIEDLPLGDRKNMAYLGTNVTYGRGVGIVTGTGMQTELGKIATLLQEVKNLQTPLQQRLDRLGKMLALIGAGAAALMLGIGVLLGESPEEMFLTAISLAVAVVPEGLPAVVTITLAIGAKRMLKRHALIRKLPAAETLGSVTVICSDKTGTLTENRMTATTLKLPDQHVELEDLQEKSGHSETVKMALCIGAWCNDATLSTNPEHEEFTIIGDPTEGALLVAAARAGLQCHFENMPRVGEYPFDSDRKRMSTVHRLPENSPGSFFEFWRDTNFMAFTKGSVDGLLEISSHIWVNGQTEKLSEAWLNQMQQANEALAREGVRVLGLAYKTLSELPQKPEADLEQDLIFVGMIGMIDPPRAAVKPAVAQCRKAGIRPIMITGDHPLTAAAIARELGITENFKALNGEALLQLSEEELREAVKEVSVFARVSPEDKLRIISALQANGEVVAMTGDGVNDAPALKKANIGVAMGITGTDVAKEASDMVLLDDNFATIVAAVEEGRVIYDNLLRFIKFSLGGNLGKVFVMLAAPLFGVHIALRPLQLLWLNLLTDGLMGLGLGTEPAEKNTMSRPPRHPDQPVLTAPDLRYVLWSGFLIGIISLGTGYFYYDPGNPQDQTWQTMIFATIGFTQIGNAFGLRANVKKPFSVKTNPLFMLMTFVTIGLQLLAIYFPPLQKTFGLAPLTAQQLGISFGLGILLFIANGLERMLNKK